MLGEQTAVGLVVETVGNALTVPLAVTFLVVAPVEVQAIFPEGVPEAEFVKRA